MKEFLSQQIENLKIITERYKLKLIEKEKEINKLKEKIIYLNKTIAFLEKRKIRNTNNSINVESDSSFLNGINKKTSGFSRKSYQKFPIKIIKRNINSNTTIQPISNSIQIIKKKYNQNNIKLSFINLNNSKNDSYFKKKAKINLNNKSIIDKRANIYSNKNIERNDFETSRNNTRKKQYIKRHDISTNNINNNFFNQKNNILINSKNMELEMIKIKSKLCDFYKMIGVKINNLKRRKGKKHKNSNDVLKRNCSFDKPNSFKYYKNFKNFNKSEIINSTNFDNMTYRTIK